MKISGFTIARDCLKYNYPVLESIQSILPLCDEFIVNVGRSSDRTLELIKTLKDPKIRIIETQWDLAQKPDMLTYQTNVALKECKGDWAFYLQSDEIIHERDLPTLKRLMQKHVNDPSVDAFRFRWLHFYGSYWRYRIDAGWFQKQDRIIRNNGAIESCTDAFTFRRKDGQELRRMKTPCFIYHYGWVHPPAIMQQRRINAENIGFVTLSEKEREREYDYGNLDELPAYFGTHPSVMEKLIEAHEPSRNDRKTIDRKWWWYPPRILKIRYKSGRREKTSLKTVKG